MNIASILTLIAKGVGVVETLYKFKEDALPAIKTVAALVTGAQQGTLTVDDLAAHEAALDGLISKFNDALE